MISFECNFTYGSIELVQKDGKYMTLYKDVNGKVLETEVHDTPIKITFYKEPKRWWEFWK